MEAFEAILAILLAAVLLSGLARRIGAPYPTLLALLGAGLALSPVHVPLAIDPDLALALFVAPVLLDSGYDTSVRDLRRNWLPISGLVLMAVGLTTAAVAWVARLMMPDLPWSAAIALGAIVAPPDASAATAVLRGVRPPHRIGVILEGESLLNDASALLVYRLAVGAAVVDGRFGVETVAPAFLVSVVGSIVAGPLAARVWLGLTNGVTHAPSAIILQFLGTFGIWVAADRLGLSAILTVVAYAITVARYAPTSSPARLRVPAYAVWETAVVVLNALAFVLIGLQLGPVIAKAQAGELVRWSLFGAAILATVILMRLVWVLIYNRVVVLGLLRTRLARPGDGPRPNWKSGLAIGWCGMRGIVTVAAALALPQDFPQRDLLLFTAFSVTLGTLVVQGLTLRPLLLALDLRDDGPVEREIRLARGILAEAALDALGTEQGLHADGLRAEMEAELRSTSEAENGDGHAILPSKQLRARLLQCRRDRLLALRRDGTIGDDAFHRLEEELDFADLAVAGHL